MPCDSLGEAAEPLRCRMRFWSRAAHAGAGGGTVRGCQGRPRHLLGSFPGAVSTSRRQSNRRTCHRTWHRRSGGFFEAADYRARFPDGRIGSAPSLSSPEDGERLYAAAVEDMIEAYQAFIAYAKA